MFELCWWRSQRRREYLPICCNTVIFNKMHHGTVLIMTIKNIQSISEMITPDIMLRHPFPNALFWMPNI